MSLQVLITGGAGFIGSHLTERLLVEGASVRVLDDLSTGSLDNLERVRPDPRLRIQVGSAMDRALVTDCMQGVDLVVHLAAAVGVRLVVEQPVHTIRTNLGATQCVLDAAAEQGCKLLLASSSEVYGKSRALPFREDGDLTLGPTHRSRWNYACSKAMDEWMAFAQVRERNSKVIIARFFNTVGPRQTGRYGMVLPNFVRQALAGEPITVFGDGSQTRCFAHVDDIVECIWRLLLEPAAENEVFNVGNDDEYKILNVAKLVKAAAQSSSKIRFVPYEQAYGEGFEDMPRRVPALDKLQRTVGFRPSRGLQSIVQELLAEAQWSPKLATP